MKHFFIFFLLILFSGLSSAQITWLEGRYFPHFPEPDTVYVDWINCPIGSGAAGVGMLTGVSANR